MKSLKTLLITLFAAFGLTGCYTQLEYGQRMRRITDKPVERYTRDDRPEKLSDSAYRGETGEEEYAGYEDEGYIPVYYKDYETAGWWDSCHCNPYSGYTYDTSFYYDDPWYYDHWRWHHHLHFDYAGYYNPFYTPYRGHFGFGFHHSFFALNFYWGNPYYYGIVYGPYWDYYYYRPYWYGYRWAYWGGGHGGWDGIHNSSRSYRPRSIGVSRVSADSRGRERVRAVNRSSSGKSSTIRSRSATRVRSRGTVQSDHTRSVVRQPRTRGTSRTTISRSRSRDNGRTRGNIQQRSRSNESRSRYIRTRGTQRIDRDRTNSSTPQVRRVRVRNDHQQFNSAVRTNRSAIESHIRRQRVSRPDNNRSGFFGRVKKFFDSDNVRLNTGRSRSPVRVDHSFNRSSHNNRSSISRPRSTSRSSVIRSSPSSSTSSRGTSGRSRSSSSRSRGN